MGANDQIVAFNDEITHWGRRKIELQGLPQFAVVEGKVNAQFSAGKQQPFANWIFSHCVHVSIRWKSTSDLRPRLAEIMRAINVWRDVVHLVAIDCDICSGHVVWGGID